MSNSRPYMSGTGAAGPDGLIPDNGASVQTSNQSTIMRSVAHRMVQRWIAGNSPKDMVPLYSAVTGSSLYADDGHQHDIFMHDPVFQKKNDPAAGVFGPLNSVPVPRTCLDVHGNMDYDKAERYFFDTYSFVGFAMEPVSFPKVSTHAKTKKLTILVRGSQITLYNSSPGIVFRSRDELIITIPRTRDTGNGTVADLAMQPAGVRSEASRTKSGRVTACYRKRDATVTKSQVSQICSVLEDIESRGIATITNVGLSEFESGVVALIRTVAELTGKDEKTDIKEIVALLKSRAGKNSLNSLLTFICSQSKALDERKVGVSLGTLNPSGIEQISVL